MRPSPADFWTRSWSTRCTSDTLQTDVALALLRRLCETSRPELLLGAMGATIEAGRIAAYLPAKVDRPD